MYLVFKISINKVDVQNNILHTLREASYGGNKQFFERIISSPPPSFAPFRALRFSIKVFGGQIRAN